MNQAKSKEIGLLFIIGFLGIVSLVPLIPALINLHPEPLPFPIEVVQIISVMQSSILLLGMVFLGSFLANKVNLRAPVIQAISMSQKVLPELRRQVLPGVMGGLSGGMVLVLFFNAYPEFIAAEFQNVVEKISLAWYAKILYGGITEELLMRWGLMSLLVWISYRLTQKKDTLIRSYNYILAIAISAILFGLGHLPLLFALISHPTFFLVVYVVLGNTAFGIIAGWLYWKKGLESSILAHVIAHIVLLIY